MSDVDGTSFRVPGLSSPAAYAAAVTPSDTVDLTSEARALFVGTGGNVRVLTVGGDTVTFNAVPAGTTLPVRVKRVYATSTTASNIVALW